MSVGGGRDWPFSVAREVFRFSVEIRSPVRGEAGLVSISGPTMATPESHGGALCMSLAIEAAKLLAPRRRRSCRANTSRR